MDIRLPKDPQFNKYYTRHCKYLKLKGLQPKTIDAYSRALRRIGNYKERLLSDICIPRQKNIGPGPFQENTSSGC